MHQRAPGLRGQFTAEAVVRQRLLVADVLGQQGVAVAGEQIGQAAGEVRVGGGVGNPARGTGARRDGRTHRDHGRGQLLGDAPQRAAVPRSGPVRLVDEQQGGDAQPLQGPHQDPGLRLYALHGGDDQDGAVEHAQHPLHLGDEIRVPGCVDQIDGDVVDGKRHDSRFDRDAAPAFQREGIGRGAAVVDAADLVDDSGGVEKPLGQTCLTGVDMRQNSQVERAGRVHGASCPSGGWKFPSGRT